MSSNGSQSFRSIEAETIEARNGRVTKQASGGSEIVNYETMAANVSTSVYFSSDSSVTGDVSLGLNDVDTGPIPSTFYAFPVAFTGVASSIYAYAFTAPGGGGTYTYELYVNSVASGVTTAISGANTTSGSSGFSYPIFAGDLVIVGVTYSGGAATSPNRHYCTVGLTKQ